VGSRREREGTGKLYYQALLVVRKGVVLPCSNAIATLECGLRNEENATAGGLVTKNSQWAGAEGRPFLI